MIDDAVGPMTFQFGPTNRPPNDDVGTYVSICHRLFYSHFVFWHTICNFSKSP